MPIVSIRHLPNTLTVARIVVTPVLLVLLFTPTLAARIAALVLFVFASISDYLDGKIARQMEAHSPFGMFLDPVADKVLVLGTFVVMAVITPQAVPWWAVLLVALRDVGVTVLRSWAASHDRSLRTLPVAKWKTSMQLLFLLLLMVLLMLLEIPGPLQRDARWVLKASDIPFALMMAVVAFTLYTGSLYLTQSRAVWHELSRASNAPR